MFKKPEKDQPVTEKPAPVKDGISIDRSSYKCPFCQVPCYLEELLLNHIKYAHPEDEEKFLDMLQGDMEDAIDKLFDG